MWKTLLSSTVAVTLVGACGNDDDVVIGPNPSGSLSVVNDSDFVIEEIFLTEVDNPDWGPNLLHGDALFPGETITLGVQCDFFDALIVDEEGVECEVDGLDLCANDATWVFRNNTCPIFAAEAAKRAAAKNQN
jgi:hypothetical protein